MRGMKEVRAKKALGQHFLKDVDVAERIAASLSDQALPILEVGPGMGMLTQFLLPLYPEVKVVELDRESVAYLHQAFPTLEVLEGDFLRLPLNELFTHRPFLLIGNYPYNISSQIFFHALEYRDQIRAIGGMLQKEVAERLAASPGGRQYGILSVFLQAWYDVEYLFTVPPVAFDPPPKVQSGVLRLVRNTRQDLGCDEALFRSVVKCAFNQRRKMLRNSLRTLLGEATLPEDCLYLTQRPEQLGVEDFITLTNQVSAVLAQG